MDTHPRRLHCAICERETPHSEYDPFLFPDTYGCMRCGRPRKLADPPAVVDEDDTLEMDQ